MEAKPAHFLVLIQLTKISNAQLNEPQIPMEYIGIKWNPNESFDIWLTWIQLIWAQSNLMKWIGVNKKPSILHFHASQIQNPEPEPDRQFQNLLRAIDSFRIF